MDRHYPYGYQEEEKEKSLPKNYQLHWNNHKKRDDEKELENWKEWINRYLRHLSTIGYISNKDRSAYKAVIPTNKDGSLNNRYLELRFKPTNSRDAIGVVIQNSCYCISNCKTSDDIINNDKPNIEEWKKNYDSKYEEKKLCCRTDCYGCNVVHETNKSRCPHGHFGLKSMLRFFKEVGCSTIRLYFNQSASQIRSIFTEDESVDIYSDEYLKNLRSFEKVFTYYCGHGHCEGYVDADDRYFDYRTISARLLFDIDKKDKKKALIRQQNKIKQILTFHQSCQGENYGTPLLDDAYDNCILLMGMENGKGKIFNITPEKIMADCPWKEIVIPSIPVAQKYYYNSYTNEVQMQVPAVFQDAKKRAEELVAQKKRLEEERKKLNEQNAKTRAKYVEEQKKMLEEEKTELDQNGLNEQPKKTKLKIMSEADQVTLASVSVAKPGGKGWTYSEKKFGDRKDGKTQNTTIIPGCFDKIFEDADKKSKGNKEDDRFVDAFNDKKSFMDFFEKIERTQELPVVELIKNAKKSHDAGTRKKFKNAKVSELDSSMCTFSYPRGGSNQITQAPVIASVDLMGFFKKILEGEDLLFSMWMSKEWTGLEKQKPGGPDTTASSNTGPSEVPEVNTDELPIVQEKNPSNGAYQTIRGKDLGYSIEQHYNNMNVDNFLSIFFES